MGRVSNTGLPCEFKDEKKRRNKFGYEQKEKKNILRNFSLFCLKYRHEIGLFKLKGIVLYDNVGALS